MIFVHIAICFIFLILCQQAELAEGKHTFLKKVDENFSAFVIIKNASVWCACIFYYKLIIKSPINVIAMLIPDLSVSFSLKRNADIKVPIAIVPPWLRV